MLKQEKKVIASITTINSQREVDLLRFRHSILAIFDVVLAQSNFALHRLLGLFSDREVSLQNTLLIGILGLIATHQNSGSGLFRLTDEVQ